MNQDWPPARPEAPSAVMLAGFWVRFVALIVDSIVIAAIDIFLAFAIGNTGAYVGILVNFAYLVAFFGSPRGQTPGFRATNLQLVSAADGGPIGPWRAAVRWLVGLVSEAVFFLGYLWMIWDRDKQTWHDKAAGSLVIRQPLVTGADVPGGGPRP